MDATAAYGFLKASLDQMPESERKKLAQMIYSEKVERPKRKKKIDPVPSVEWYKKMLARTIFKNS